MNAEEYRSLINDKDALNHTILDVTLKELVSKQEFELSGKLKRILESNRIAKPKLHTKPYDSSTTYYKIDLSSDDIEKIIDILFELEIAHVGEEGETTLKASFYGSLVDKWNKLT